MQGAAMNGPLDSGASNPTPRGLWPAQRVPAPTLVNFAKALRQRGLLTRAEPASLGDGWSEVPDLWVAHSSVYESHLRRVAMEQVFAVLRREDDEPA
jgi:hypothetical protein